MNEKKHILAPTDTRAYICAKCGAVALNANNICKVEGMGTKSDWCGIRGSIPPADCHNRADKDRYQCRSCGLTAINPELLCKPETLSVPQ